MSVLNRSGISLVCRLSRVSSLLAAALSPAWALAHDGHGQTGSHWHASDTAGFMLVAAVAAAGIWWSRRK